MSNGAGPIRYDEWIGRQETRSDVAGRVPVERLADLLDHETPPWRDGILPPLGHWLYFGPRARSSEIDVDGHPKRGGFLPPIHLPRRMWAGGEVEFHGPIPIDAVMQRTSRIADVRQKSGSSGELFFVTLIHEIGVEGRLAVSERQDLVYRQSAGSPAPASEATAVSIRPADVERRVALRAADLFRFSALTYNAHRIHYDRDYARDVEGYAGLVVHGPFSAMLLMDHLLRTEPDRPVRRFSFRGVRPLLDLAPFDLCLARDEERAALWCRDASGAETMTATVA